MRISARGKLGWRRSVRWLLPVAAVLAVMVLDSAGKSAPGGVVYIWPLDLPRQLSGTLGEVRGYTFHSGIDIKTRGRNGFPVMAVAGGRLYRVISRQTGYGNAVFLSHDDGLMSVYAHLDSLDEGTRRLDTTISVLKTLYNSDSVDFIFRQGEFFYKKGQRIAYSGESGTGTPHLHLELRGKGVYMNPLGLIRVEDKEAPVIDAVYVCSERDGTTVYERRIPVRKRWGRYSADETRIRLSPTGRVFLKVSCFDRAGALNSVAVQRITLRENARTRFDMGFDAIRESDFRYGHLVYDISKSTIDGAVTYTYFLCRRPGNAYSGLRDSDGGYMAADGKKRRICIEARDFAGNRSELGFDLTVDPGNEKDEGALKWRPAPAVTDRFSMDVSPPTLLSIEEMPASKIREAAKAPPDPGVVLALFAVRPFDVLHARPAIVSIRAAVAMGNSGAGKVSIYQFFEGKKPRPLPTRYNPRSGRHEAMSKVNGYFALILDERPPEIYMPPTHEFVEEGPVFTKMRFFALDALSELNAASIECFFNGELIPASYDPDRKWIEIILPRRAVSGGVHHVMLVCADNAGNRTVFTNLVRL